jgi:hypothetical protein
MKIKEKTTKKVVIELTKAEMWFLTRHFGPGWIFGFTDPSIELSSEEINALESRAFHSLEKEDVIRRDQTGQIEVDEMIGAMIYSCINPNDVLIISSPENEAKQIFNFLPNWQLELSKSNENYVMTLYDSREDILPAILDSNSVTLKSFEGSLSFLFNEKELEMSLFLYKSGKIEKAKEILTDLNSQPSNPLEFLEYYSSPDFHFIFDIIYDQNKSEKTHSVRNELIQTEMGLFWGVYNEIPDVGKRLLKFTPLNPESVKSRFLRMLPQH